MANTYTQIYIQVVFAVEDRASLVRPSFKEDIYKFMTGVIKQEKQKLIAINGMPDHVHLLIGLKPDIALSALVRDVKAKSSKWVNERGLVKGKFRWQEGFGAFSYGHSQLDAIVRYIQDQEQHHVKRTFRNEYFALLRKFDIAFQDKYVFNFIEGTAPGEL
jgi:REP-associated tyrosine transposase